MKLKKNPQADLSRRTGLFFSIGLAIATFASLYAINYKTEIGDKDKIVHEDLASNLDENVEEVHLDMNTPPPPPPPPPVAEPEVLQVVDDKVEVKVEIQHTETNKNEKVAEAAPVIERGPATEPDDDNVVVPFAVIEDKPMFEACKDLPKDKQDACFKQQLDNHVRKNFKYPEAAMEMGIQGKVIVQFRINKDGTVEVMVAKGKDEILEKEARRIIEKMPKLIPGKQRNKPVAVTYAYPIVFKLN